MTEIVVDDKYMARVYLAQARAVRIAGRHHGWFFTLMGWAAKRRRAAMRVPMQRELFAA